MAHGIYDFTIEDLAANKKGLLTGKQKTYLKGIAYGVRTSSGFTMKITLVFVCLGIAIMGFMVLQSDSTYSSLLRDSNIIAIILAAVILIILLGLSKFLAKKTASGLEDGIIFTATGEIRHDREHSPNSAITAYYVYVGEKRFSFTTIMDSVFQTGKTYNVYYVKSGAIEPILSYEKT